MRPFFEGARERRELYATPWVHEEVFETQKARMAQLHADLDRFIGGGSIAVGGRAAKDAFMKLLEPSRDGVWEIRSIDPKPSFRVFGLFAERDCFVATSVQERKLLGAFDSLQWRRARRHALAQWRGLFATWPPHRGEHLDDYLTNAVEL